MKRWIVVLVVVLVIVGGLVLVLRNNKTKDDHADMTNASQNSNSQGSTATATNEVTIKNFSFSPAKITVKKGTKVTWTNKDETTHTVTSDSGSTMQSDSLDPGESYSTTFDTAGSFPYHCSFHTSMVGTVTVTE